MQTLRHRNFTGKPGNGLTVSGEALDGHNLRFTDNRDAGLELEDADGSHVAESVAARNDVGMRISSSDCLIEDVEIKENRGTGLVIEGDRNVVTGTVTGNGTADSKVDVIDSEITDNPVDIQYGRNVLVRIFDTAAWELRNVAWSTVNIDRVDAEWISGRILDTTDVQAKARLLVKWAKRFGGFIFTNALWQAIQAALRHL